MGAPNDPLEGGDCGANAAPYVLGALSEAECEAFRRHMDSCAICREEVASLQVVAATLPAAAPQLSAPRELKQRVMSSVHAEAALIAASERARASSPRVHGGLGWRGSPRTLGWRHAGAALAAVVVIALAAIGLTRGATGGPVRVVRAQVLAPRASASVRLQDGGAQLSIAGLPQPTRGRIYEVWLKGAGAAQPTDALFTVSSSGAATVAVPGITHATRELMVTSEPLGGSRTPTSAPVIIARVS
ncbi:MAG TPA: anti-sigma factor [Solirubrobacteraceae bacterium]|jgi:anti-sigma-K factor RskA